MKLHGAPQGFVNCGWGVCPLSQGTTSSTSKPRTSVLYLGCCSSLNTSSGPVKGWGFHFGTSKLFDGTYSGVVQLSQLPLICSLSYRGISRCVLVLDIKTGKDFQVSC